MPKIVVEVSEEHLDKISKGNWRIASTKRGMTPYAFSKFEVDIKKAVGLAVEEKESGSE